MKKLLLFYFFIFYLNGESIKLIDNLNFYHDSFGLDSQDKLWQKTLGFVSKNIDSVGLCDLLQKKGFLIDVNRSKLIFDWFKSIFSIYKPSIINPTLKRVDIFSDPKLVSDIYISHSGLKAIIYSDPNNILDYNFSIINKEGKVVLSDKGFDGAYGKIRGFESGSKKSFLAFSKNRDRYCTFNLFQKKNRVLRSFLIEDMFSTLDGVLFNSCNTSNFDFLNSNRFVIVQVLENNLSAVILDKNLNNENFNFLFSGSELRELELDPSFFLNFNPQIFTFDKKNFLVFGQDVAWVFNLKNLSADLVYKKVLHGVLAINYLQNGEVVVLFKNGYLRKYNWAGADLKEVDSRFFLSNVNFLNSRSYSIIPLKNNSFAFFKEDKVYIFDKNLNKIKSFKVSYFINSFLTNSAKDELVLVENDAQKNTYVEILDLNGNQKDLLSFKDNEVKKIVHQDDDSYLIWIVSASGKNSLIKYEPFSIEDVKEVFKISDGDTVSIEKICNFARFYEDPEKYLKRSFSSEFEQSYAKRRAVGN